MADDNSYNLPLDEDDVPGDWWGECIREEGQSNDSAIILVGYMCVGKTTVGKALAERLGRTFYDLDWYIEERFHTKVSNIFAEKGEEGFRELERRMLREVAEFENVVLSCGGGTPCFFDNIDYMNSVGRVVYLKASPETILRHLAISRGERPLLKDKSPEELSQFVSTQLSEREPFYQKAAYTINVQPLDDFDKVGDIVNQIIERTGTVEVKKY